jgi:hypothetical protein
MNDFTADWTDAAQNRSAESRVGGPMLLRNEPRTLASATEIALTDCYLLPARAELEALFLAVRALVDPELRRNQPVKLGKPYPLGQCLEITLAIQRPLRKLDALPLSGMAAQGRAALSKFLRAGGTFRRAWGDLRGEFFQNAFQLGTLYIDVSNDTVTASKPKVEILPFAEAQFTPIADFSHFTHIAERYWQDRIYPNHILPELAPYCPLLHINQQGLVQLRDATGYMLALATSGRFQPSEDVLRAPAAMPTGLFDSMTDALRGRKLTLAASPEAGRTQALRLCRDYRAKRWHQSPAQTAKAIRAVQQANLRLAQWHHSTSRAPAPQPNTAPLQDTQPMPTLTIDNNTYELDSLSPEAKAQLQSIQFVDQELARLQAHVAALQTARHAYVNALKAALPARTE